MLVHVGAASRLAHNYLVHLQDGQAGVDREFQSPRFVVPGIENTTLDLIYILDLSVSDINAEVVALLSGSDQISDDLFTLVAGILSNDPWNNFKGLAESFDSVRIKTLLGLCEFLNSLTEIYLSGTSSWKKPLVSA